MSIIASNFYRKRRKRMGWFSATITGGDSPMDWTAFLEQRAGAGRYSEPPVPLTAEMINNNLNKMTKSIEKNGKALKIECGDNCSSLPSLPPPFNQ
jgi:hypothetical protein